jgi:hypothetical protein
MSLVKISKIPTGASSILKKMKSGFVDFGKNTEAKRSLLSSMASKSKGIGKTNGRHMKQYGGTTIAKDNYRKAIKYLNSNPSGSFKKLRG